MATNLTSEQIRENTAKEVNLSNWKAKLWSLFGIFSIFPQARNITDAESKAAEGAANAALVDQAQGSNSSAMRQEMLEKSRSKNRGSILYSFLGALGIAGGEAVAETAKVAGGAGAAPVAAVGLLGGFAVAIASLFGAIRKKSEAMVASSEAGVIKAIADNKGVSPAQMQANHLRDDANTMYTPKVAELSSDAKPLMQQAQAANESPVMENTLVVPGQQRVV